MNDFQLIKILSNNNYTVELSKRDDLDNLVSFLIKQQNKNCYCISVNTKFDYQRIIEMIYFFTELKFNLEDYPYNY